MCDEFLIPFQVKGTKLQFESRVPIARKLEHCEHYHLTSTTPWEPDTVKLQELQTAIQNELDTIPFDCLYRSPESITRAIIQQVQIEDPLKDSANYWTLISKDRHSILTPHVLAERFGIGPHRARATIRATMQKGIRSAILPLSHRYKTDRFYDTKRLRGKFATDTFYPTTKSLLGYTSSQVYMEHLNNLLLMVLWSR